MMDTKKIAVSSQLTAEKVKVLSDELYELEKQIADAFGIVGSSVALLSEGLTFRGYINGKYAYYIGKSAGDVVTRLAIEYSPMAMAATKRSQAAVLNHEAEMLEESIINQHK